MHVSLRAAQQLSNKGNSREYTINLVEAMQSHFIWLTLKAVVVMEFREQLFVLMADDNSAINLKFFNVLQML